MGTELDIYNKNLVLSIAGFDPCGGAGVLADMQTFVRHHVTGMTVTTSITSQDEDTVFGIEWLSIEQLEFQLRPIIQRYNFEFIKIGLIENMERLAEIIELIKKYSTRKVKIIWDPIIRSSSGFKVLEKDNHLLKSLVKDLYLITPNLIEYDWLVSQLGTQIETNLLIKGGHREGNDTSDILISIIDEKKIIKGTKLNNRDKHGTGCVLSASILSGLAQGKTLEKACVQAKKYIESYLLSSHTKLGRHYTIDT